MRPEFHININDNEVAYWQFRFRYEKNNKHKKILSRKHLVHLSMQNNKDESLLVDFLYNYDKNGSKFISRYGMLVADYDTLPKGFSNYDDFRTYLNLQFPFAFVVKTPSNKAKVLFLVEHCGLNIKNASRLRLKALEAILGEERLLCFDRNVNSMHKVYFNHEMIMRWRKDRKKIRLLGNVSDFCQKQDKQTSKNISLMQPVIITTPKLKVFEGTIPEEILNIGGKSKYFEKFIRILVASPALDKNTKLPQRNIAKFLDVSPTVVNRYIKLLIKEGLLYDIDKSYMVGVKAKGYRAYGKLLDLHREFKLKCIRKDVLDVKEIKIAEGEWNKQLFLLTNYFSSKDAYLKFVENLEGIHEKHTRIKQAKWAWINHERRATLKGKDNIVDTI